MSWPGPAAWWPAASLPCCPSPAPSARRPTASSSQAWLTRTRRAGRQFNRTTLGLRFSLKNHFSFGLKNHLTCGLRFPKLIKSSKMSQNQNGILSDFTNQNSGKLFSIELPPRKRGRGLRACFAPPQSEMGMAISFTSFLVCCCLDISKTCSVLRVLLHLLHTVFAFTVLIKQCSNLARSTVVLDK